MTPLGRTPHENAVEFVARFPSSTLGSLAGDGMRRVSTSATGVDLDEQKAQFAMIAVAAIAESPVPPVILETTLLPCIDRGAKRHVCCGSPDLWICRQLGSDCVATEDAKSRLLSMVQTQEASGVKVCETCTFRREPETASATLPVALDYESVAVVVPCHNYARFLPECLQSLKAQSFRPTQILVVDDSSTDNPEAVCQQFDGVEYIRCEVKDVHEARAAGLARVNTTFVAFLDADDKLPPGYFEEAISLFREDRRIAITYPTLEYFGDASGPAHGTQNAPDQLTADGLEQRNWICAGSVIRVELLHQSLAFRGKKIDGSRCWSQDWSVAKAVLRSGVSWIAKKMKTPLMYRKHGTNMSARPNDSYWNDAYFENETITVVIAFSGRWDCWAKLRTWLVTQEWPRQQLRLLIINATHQPLSPANLGLESWDGSIQIEKFDAGYPRLGDIERRNAPGVCKAVEAAVAGIYNTAVRLLGTEYVVFIEDDVIPKRSNAIEMLLMQMGPWVAGVSGVYRTRYQTDKCCAFSVPYTGVESFKSLQGEGVEVVGGSGFGCLLTRRSLLRRFPLAGDSSASYFDLEFALNVSRCDNGWWKWLLNREVQADHLMISASDMPPVSQTTAKTAP